MNVMKRRLHETPDDGEASSQPNGDHGMRDERKNGQAARLRIVGSE